jgi:hypothetical protein
LADVYQSIALFATEFAEAQLDATDDEPVVASGDDLAHMRLTLETIQDPLARVGKLAGLINQDDDMGVYERYLEAGGEHVDLTRASRWRRWASRR